MATLATIIYPYSANRQDKFPAGVAFMSPEGVHRRAVYYSLQQQAGLVAVGWTLQTKIVSLDGQESWVTDPAANTSALLVGEDGYRSLTTFQVVPKSEACNPDGSLKPGYMTEYDFFELFFGMDNNQPYGIYHFVADALVRRLNIDYPDLDLVLS